MDTCVTHTPCYHTQHHREQFHTHAPEDLQEMFSGTATSYCLCIVTVTGTARLLWGQGQRGQLHSAGGAAPAEGPAEQEPCLAESSGAGSRFPYLGKVHLSLVGSDFESHVSPPLQPAQWFMVKCSLICCLIIFSLPRPQVFQGQARGFSLWLVFYALCLSQS